MYSPNMTSHEALQAAWRLRKRIGPKPWLDHVGFVQDTEGKTTLLAVLKPNVPEAPVQVQVPHIFEGHPVVTSSKFKLRGSFSALGF